MNLVDALAGGQDAVGDHRAHAIGNRSSRADSFNDRHQTLLLYTVYNYKGARTLAFGANVKMPRPPAASHPETVDVSRALRHAGTCGRTGTESCSGLSASSPRRRAGSST